MKNEELDCAISCGECGHSCIMSVKQLFVFWPGKRIMTELSWALLADTLGTSGGSK